VRLTNDALSGNTARNWPEAMAAGTPPAVDRPMNSHPGKSVLVGPVLVGTGPVRPDDVVAVTRHGAAVELTEDARAAIDRARAVIESLVVSGTPAYGVSTGSERWRPGTSPPSLRARLQRSLVRSHAAGSGPEVEREVVRALMLLRLSTLATGRTGERRETAELMAAMFSAGITLVAREYGSLGCSGDLAPLAHRAVARQLPRSQAPR
jgi:histidine ammonia-lyase